MSRADLVYNLAVVVACRDRTDESAAACRVALADLLARRDAAAVAFERAEAQFRGTLPGALYRAGSVDAYNIRQDARLARREAQDAVDAAQAAES